MSCFYNLDKYIKIQITDTTEIEFPNRGSEFLQFWVARCNDKNDKSKIANFALSTKTSSSTTDSGVNSLPPIGSAVWYVETSGVHYGISRVFFY